MYASQIRANAREALKDKWGKGVCIILAYLAFEFLIGFVIGFFGLGESTFGDLIITIIDVPLTLGLTYAFIKLKRNEDVKAFDFLDIGFSNFARSWKISLRTGLKLILPILGMLAGLFLISYGTVMSMSIFVFSDTSNIGQLLIIAGMIIMLISWFVLFVKGLLYSLTLYIAYDNPDMTSSEVISASENMMRGNRGNLFVLNLSFIGWVILSIITFGIGLLWVLPYMQIASVCFYEALVEKRENNI